MKPDQTSTTRRRFVQSIPAIGAGLLLGENQAFAAEGQAPQPSPGDDSWHSQSLTTETVTGLNGSITTPTSLTVDARLGVTESKTVEVVAAGVYALRGWGIGASFAIEAPDGWIIVDTGDSTQAATEMREMLEGKVGKKIKVAAILLTHWHYAEGTAAWLDEGTELWGHEHLDRNRSAASGISVIGGQLMARMTAQFGVFHPAKGPDSFPNLLSFRRKNSCSCRATNRRPNCSRTARSSRRLSPASPSRSRRAARTCWTASRSTSRSAG